MPGQVKLDLSKSVPISNQGNAPVTLDLSKSVPVGQDQPASFDETHFGPGGLITPQSPQFLQSLGRKWDSVENALTGATVGKASESIDAASQGQYAKAANKGIQSAGAILSPFIFKGLATAPLATAVGIGTGVAASKGGELVSRMAGLSPDQAELAGNVLGIGAGAITGALASQPGRAMLASRISKLTPEQTKMLINILSPREAAKDYLKRQLLSSLNKTPESVTPAESSAIDSSIDKVASTPLKGNNPAQQQADMFRKMGVASPSVSGKPMTAIPEATLKPRMDLTFPGAKNGESAILYQLTRTGINGLRAIALQRGLRIGPGDTDRAIIAKIMGSVTSDEISNFAAQAAENQRRPRNILSQ